MICNKKLVIAATLTMTTMVLPAAAHHSFAMFDQTKSLNLKSVTVTKFVWTNPHAFVVLDVKGVKYVLECSSTNMMSRAGWKVNSIKAGDRVDVNYHPLRTAKPGGMLKTITLPDGTTLNAW